MRKKGYLVSDFIEITDNIDNFKMDDSSKQAITLSRKYKINKKASSKSLQLSIL